MARQRKLWFEGPVGRLEGALRVAARPRGAAVVAHPHPLHGGTLHNPVVFHCERELHRIGLNTLRFNFRGAGTSDGVHDDGRGEVDDVAAAASWLRGIVPDAPLLLVGYSFGGACCVRHALAADDVAGVVAIGLPVRLYDFREDVRRLARPLAIVQGSDDEFGTPDEVRAVLAGTDPPAALHVVEGTAHLFDRRASDAAAHVVTAVESILAGLEES